MSDHHNRGEGNGRAKMTWDKVRKLRSLNELDPKQYKQEVLSKMFNISQPAVCQILQKKRWWPDLDAEKNNESYRAAKKSIEALESILDMINDGDLDG